MAEWFKAPDSSFGPRERVWDQIPLLTFCFLIFLLMGQGFIGFFFFYSHLSF
ncbi:hypothetical protein ERO13_D12G109666v2 [Gossypium hirsutum]|uniref:Uncharacterized protein n=2 Tax=Gossypium TaxID=3633 RepID=A0A5J5NXL3_GOSBA|nr:hypothetical protein ES319_D12G121100v1 [Gossypium barbadense]KAG4115517.1 hypothetical protein ERO13_D12G109666v2 [Gossypium hirsutum]TYI50731.1 hypothetical protein E1A91_D12G123000v1 [Gossypium mustelinum]